MSDEQTTRETVESWIKAYGVACICASSSNRNGDKAAAEMHTSEARHLELWILNAFDSAAKGKDVEVKGADEPYALTNIQWAMNRLKVLAGTGNHAEEVRACEAIIRAERLIAETGT